MSLIRSRRALTALFVGAPILTMAAGCVPQDRYDQLQTAHRSLLERTLTIEADRDSSREELLVLQSSIDGMRNENGRLRSQLNQLGADIDAAENANREAMAMVSEIDFGGLPIEVTSELEALAAQNVGIMTFDKARGMLRFASDVTFGSGSDQLSETARQTISSVSNVLKNVGARDLLIQVVGHTDNVPIGKSRAKHPTNMHLSAHRAISVRDAMVTAGINPERIQIGGFGPFHPVAANGPNGSAQNRRVEIFLTKGTGVSAGTASMARPETNVAAPASTPSRPEPMK